MSLRAIASLRLGLGWVSKELKTEPSFMSDKTGRIASQVKKEDGGAEVCTGNREGEESDRSREKETWVGGGQEMMRPFLHPWSPQHPSGAHGTPGEPTVFSSHWSPGSIPSYPISQC